MKSSTQHFIQEEVARWDFWLIPAEEQFACEATPCGSGCSLTAMIGLYGSRGNQRVCAP
jgi:hypothetical protein